MNILNIARNHTAPVYLLGAASLCAAYDSSRTPERILYHSEIPICEPGFSEHVLDAAYDFTSIGNVYMMTRLDIFCFALKEKDLDLLTDVTLYSKTVNCKNIRERYYELYRRRLPHTFERWISNVKDSNVAKFIENRGMSYSQFIDGIDNLCKVLNCSEEGLNDAIAQYTE